MKRERKRERKNAYAIMNREKKKNRYSTNERILPSNNRIL